MQYLNLSECADKPDRPHARPFDGIREPWVIEAWSEQI